MITSIAEIDLLYLNESCDNLYYIIQCQNQTNINTMIWLDINIFEFELRR